MADQELPYKCDICRCSFSYHSGLLRHLNQLNHQHRVAALKHSEASPVHFDDMLASPLVDLEDEEEAYEREMDLLEAEMDPTKGFDYDNDEDSSFEDDEVEDRGFEDHGVEDRGLEDEQPAMNAFSLFTRFHGAMHGHSTTGNGSGWGPYFSSMVEFVMYLVIYAIDCSQQDFRNLWQLIKMLGVQNMPTFSAVLNMKKRLRLFPVLEVVTPRGIKYFMIDPITIVKSDVCNPSVAQAIHAAGVPDPTYIQNDWDASKWQDEPPVSCCSNNGNTYWIGDFILFNEGVEANEVSWGQITGFTYKLILLVSTLIVVVNVYGKALPEQVLLNPDRIFSVADVNIDELLLTMEQKNIVENFQRIGNLAQSLPNLNVHYKLWIDDMSGVRGNKYSPWLNCRMINAALPLSEQMKLKNLHFISSASCHDAMDMVHPLVDKMREMELGFQGFDAFSKQQVFIRVCWLSLLGDNPMLEKASMITGKNCCRMCSCSTTQSVTGAPRNMDSTLRTFIYDHENLKDYGICPHYSPFFSLLSLDPHRDFGWDYLHNISLGTVKWLTQISIKKSHFKKTLWGIIDAFPFKASGFSFGQTGRRVIRYHGSFEGRDFKNLVQYFVFVLDEADAPKEMIDVWEKVALISAKLWQLRFARTELQALQDELVDCAQSLHTWDARFKEIRKVHVVVHDTDCICRIGTNRSCCVASLESSNKVTRHNKLEHTNSKNVSRDIAIIEADEATLRHLLSASTTLDGEPLNFENELVTFLEENKINQLMGFETPETNARIPGKAKFENRQKTDKNQEASFKAVVDHQGDLVRVGQYFTDPDDQIFFLDAVSLNTVWCRPVMMTDQVWRSCPVLDILQQQQEFSTNRVKKRTSVVFHRMQLLLNVFAHQ